MPPVFIPAWLILLTQSHFGVVCGVICFVITSVMVVLEKILINAGRMSRNILAFSAVIIPGAGMFLGIDIYRSAFNLGIGQACPGFVRYYVYSISIFSGLITLVLCLKDMKEK